MPSLYVPGTNTGSLLNYGIGGSGSAGNAPSNNDERVANSNAEVSADTSAGLNRPLY